MAATASLLKASSFVHRDSKPPLPLQWRNPMLRTTTAQIPPPCIKKSTTSTGFIKCSSSSSRGPSAFSVQCVMMNSKKCFMEEVEEEGDKERKQKQKQNLFEGFAEVMLKALQKPAVTAILLGVLLFAAACVPYSAIAASGGRMAGRASSSRSSSSRSSSSSSRSSSSPSSRRKDGQCEGVDLGSLFFVGFFFWWMVCELCNAVFELCQLVCAKWGAFLSVLLTDTQKTTTVLKLQVGLMGMKRSLQRDLDRIAETADTSTDKGLSYVLLETTSVLLKHPNCCISAYSSVDVKQNIGDGEKLFNELCIEEREKFNEETLVNVNNIKIQETSSKGSS